VLAAAAGAILDSFLPHAEVVTLVGRRTSASSASHPKILQPEPVST